MLALLSFPRHIVLAVSAALSLFTYAPCAHAIDRIVLEAGEITISGVTVSQARVALHLGKQALEIEEARFARLDFTNEAGTIVAEKIAAAVSGTLRMDPKATAFTLSLQGTAGQALAGPVLLDFTANPLKLAAQGTLSGSTLQLESVTIDQRELLQAGGAAEVILGKTPTVKEARIELKSLQFPAAYTSFLQITLATTGLGALETSGRAQAEIEMIDNTPQRLTVQLQDLDIEDTQGKFSVADLAGQVHWQDAQPGATSFLTWSRSQAFGLEGAEARLDFRVTGRDFELTEIARLPVFDGTVVIDALSVREMGTPAMELAFNGLIEPISMPLLSKAFGWPELQGQLAGRIPGVAYRNDELTVDGDLVARVFDGTIVGSGFRVRDPLGPWPRLFADITARQLDLELVTGTFSIGTITGRLDADIRGLELFNWSPVAFDARLYTTPGDRSPHRISQKAVTSISSVGGGTSGVTRALQGGVLRFFEQFRYDRIGLTCRLRNDVCLMSGVEPVGSGYYIVKGAGLPRINIVGNAGRVDWPQLMSQIVAGMKSEGVVVR